MASTLRFRPLRQIVPFILLLTSFPSARAQHLCPEYEEIDPLKECLTVSSYAEFVDLIESSPSGTKLDLCPFFLQKVEAVTPVRVLSGIQVRCIRKTKSDICTISGEGYHVWIDTAENTLWQGMSFRNSNDHVVYFAGEVDNSENGTHTFCQTSFINNVRFLDDQGGSLMIEPTVGTINVVECLFLENFSKTRGAGIYGRGNQLNVINSVFVTNRSNGYGPAIFTESGTSLMIMGSSFLNNQGRENVDVVFSGEGGTEIYEDGLGNASNDQSCQGIYNLANATCVTFETPPASTTNNTNTSTTIVASNHTPAPGFAINSTKSPATADAAGQATSAPSGQGPVLNSTRSPFLPVSANPTVLMSDSPSFVPSDSPSGLPTLVTTNPPIPPSFTNSPTDIPATLEPTGPESSNPSQPNSAAPGVNGRNSTESPSLSSTGDPTQRPSDAPSFEPSVNPSSVPTHSISSLPTLIPTPNPTVATSQVAPTPVATISPSVSVSSHSKCAFDPFEGDCIQVASYDDFKVAIEQGGDEVVFCGNFVLEKTDVEPLLISRDVDVRCLQQCSLFGLAPYMEIGGALTQTRIHNIKFQNSVDASAVLVSTLTALSVTTLCEAEFASNRALPGENGGAITIDSTSGVVNIVQSRFTDNSATRGGAIYSEGYLLNITDSRFVYNKAFQTGSAVYVGDGSHIAISGTTFLLNTIDTTSETFSDENDHVITVQPSLSIRDDVRLGQANDDGFNRVIMSGNCNGFWVLSSQECLEFDSSRRR